VPQVIEKHGLPSWLVCLVCVCVWVCVTGCMVAPVMSVCCCVAVSSMTFKGR